MKIRSEAGEGGEGEGSGPVTLLPFSHLLLHLLSPPLLLLPVSGRRGAAGSLHRRTSVISVLLLVSFRSSVLKEHLSQRAEPPERSLHRSF